MSRKCKLSGKGPLVGNNVSHAHNKTKMRQLPNLQLKRVYIPEEDRFVKIRVTTSALRTIDKKGLITFLKDEGLTLKDVS